VGAVLIPWNFFSCLTCCPNPQIFLRIQILFSEADPRTETKIESVAKVRTRVAVKRDPDSVANSQNQILSAVKLDPDTIANSQNQILIAVKLDPDTAANSQNQILSAVKSDPDSVANNQYQILIAVKSDPDTVANS
jgi:uncharacterized ferredoxin-like protein